MSGALEIARKFIDETDWDLFDKRNAHLISSPSCEIYDGKILCPAWKSWISSGRELYPSTNEGEREYIERLMKKEPGLKRKDITGVLNEQ